MVFVDQYLLKDVFRLKIVTVSRKRQNVYTYGAKNAFYRFTAGHRPTVHST